MKGSKRRSTFLSDRRNGPADEQSFDTAHVRRSHVHMSPGTGESVVILEAYSTVKVCGTTALVTSVLDVFHNMIEATRCDDS